MYKKGVLFCCIVCTCFVHLNARALPECVGKTETECPNIIGCWWQTGTCTNCGAGEYYDNTDKSCKSCPSDRPYSAVGSVNGISDCRAAQIACNTAGLTGCSGTIGGNANWDDNAGAYKYSTCTCAQSGVAIEHGKKSQTCYFNDAGNTVTNSCSEPTVTSCDAGYYANGGACVQTTAGYYSGNGATTQTKCPYGSTSAAGAESIDDCYFTQVCDKNNRCYTLPSAKLSNTLKKASTQN